jgi:transcriptional regulator with XRE-family HTH domain
MNTLRNIRQQKKLTLEDISSLTGLTIPHLSWIETGKIVPSIHTKIRLERIFGDIDFMVMDDRSVDSDYISCEYQFRYLMRMLRGLPEAEQKQFCICAVKHLTKIKGGI